MVSEIRKTSFSMFICLDSQGSWRSMHPRRAWKSLQKTEAHKESHLICSPSAHMVAAKWTFGLCFPDLFLPKLHSSVYSEDFTTVTAVGRQFHRIKHEKQWWAISQKHRAESMKWIKLVLNMALRGKREKERKKKKKMTVARGEVRLERGNISKEIKSNKKTNEKKMTWQSYYWCSGTIASLSEKYQITHLRTS